MTTNTERAEEIALRCLEDEKEVRHCLDLVLREQVLHSLGQPPDLLQVQVRPLWPGHYRFNVLLGTDSTSARIGHSYFLTVSEDGKLLSATPKIVRAY